MTKKELLNEIVNLKEKVNNQMISNHRLFTILCNKLNVDYCVDLEGTIIDDVNIDDENEWNRYVMKNNPFIKEKDIDNFLNRPEPVGTPISEEDRLRIKKYLYLT